MSVLKMDSSLDAATAELLEQLIDKLQAGDATIESFITAHAEHEAALRRLLPALELMAGLSENRRTSSAANSDCGMQNSELDVAAAQAAFHNPHSEFHTLGDFRILREVGRGGMGVVYEAEQLSLRRRVALKVLPFAAVLDPKQLQRFKNEALAAAQLDHPHIVDVLGVGQDRGTHFYAMRFIEGCTLADVIAELADTNPQREPGQVQGSEVRVQAREGEAPAEPTRPPPLPNPQSAIPNPQSKIPNPQSPADTKSIAGLLTDKDGTRGREFFRRAAALIADAADALEHAHSLGIVHRDIKPGNLLLDQTDKIWVSDFGLAHFADSATLTMTGDLIGTLRYMPPEQALAKHGLVDHRADIYALGCTLYELLTTFPAVLGQERGQILHQIAHEEALPPRKLNKLIPTELEIITLKCLAKSPDERYSTAGELAADLRCWLSDKPLIAKPPTARQRLTRCARRHKTLVTTTVAALAIALTFGAAVMGVSQSRLKNAAAAEAAQRRRAEAGERLAKEGQAESERQRAGAMRNFETALTAVDRLLMHLGADELYEAPSVQPVRRTMLMDALTLYKQLRPDAVNSPQIRYRMSHTWHHLGYLLEEIGEGDSAPECYERGIAAAESIVADDPDNAEYLCLLADSYAAARLGVGTLERRQRAAEIYAKLIEQKAATTHEFPTRDGSIANRYVNALRLAGKNDLALEAAERFGPTADLGRSAALKTKARSFCSTSPEEAEHLYLEALSVFRAWRERDTASERRDAQSTYSLLAKEIAGHQLAMGHLDEAEALCRESLEIKRLLVAKFPNNPGYKLHAADILFTLAFLLDQLADVASGQNNPELATNRLEEAESVFEEASAIRRGVFDGGPQSYLLDIGGLVGLLFRHRNYLIRRLPGKKSEEVLRSLSRIDAVTDSWLEASRDRVKRDPSNSVFRASLGFNLTAAARQQLMLAARMRNSEPDTARRRRDEAMSIFAEAKQIYTALLTESPGNAEYANRLAAIQADYFNHECAALKERAESLEKARSFADAESVWRDLHAQAESQLGTEHWEARHALEKIGWALHNQGKLPEAELVLRQALAAAEKSAPDSWTTFYWKGLLGKVPLRDARNIVTTDPVRANQRFAEAEALILTGYEGMIVRDQEFPAADRKRQRSDIIRLLIPLYQTWGKPAEAAKWRAALKVLDQQ